MFWLILFCLSFLSSVAEVDICDKDVCSSNGSAMLQTKFELQSKAFGVDDECVKKVGSCHFLSCDSSKNATCTNHECVCGSGMCGQNGKCMAQTACRRKTGGTCQYFGCSSKRGDGVKCATDKKGDYVCQCKCGYCSHNVNGYGVCKLSANFVNASIKRLYRGYHHHRSVVYSEEDRINSAICFSEGGSRSAALTMGFIRALHNLSLFEKFDAVSCVGGGCWTAGLFQFLDKPVEQVLGLMTAIENLTMEVLDSTQTTISNVINNDLFSTEDYDDTAQGKVWSQMIGKKIFEKGAGMDVKTQFVVANQSVVDSIREKNPDLFKNCSENPFLIQRPNRPSTIVMGGTLLVSTENGIEKLPLQMSPDFVSIAHYKNASGEEVGGHATPTYAYGGSGPTDVMGDTLPGPEEPFTLIDMVAMTSGAMAHTLYNTYDHISENILPRVNFWSVQDANQSSDKAKQTMVTSGSEIDASSLNAMLQRGATRVAWIINTNESLTGDWCRNHPGRVDETFSEKFLRSGQEVPDNPNQIFHYQDLAPILCKLQQKRDEGKPALVTHKLRTSPSVFWSIPHNQEIHLLVYYNEKCKNFEEKLPEDTRDALNVSKYGPNEVNRFPYYYTYENNPGQHTALSRTQVNLLAALAESAVTATASDFEDILQV